MNINIQTKHFQQNLVQTIQSSQLPIGVVYYILKNQLHEIENLYNTTVDKIQEQYYEKQKQEQQKQKEQKKEDFIQEKQEEKEEQNQQNIEKNQSIIEEIQD